MIPQGTFDAIKTQRTAAMRDEARFFTMEADDTTEGAYDATETVHYDGAASVRTQARELRRQADGDAFQEADAIVVLPLIESTAEDALQESRCEATFRGQTRTGTATETRRRDVTILVGVRWD